MRQQRFEQHFFLPEQPFQVFLQRFFLRFRFFFASTSGVSAWKMASAVPPATSRSIARRDSPAPIRDLAIWSNRFPSNESPHKFTTHTSHAISAPKSGANEG